MEQIDNTLDTITFYLDEIADRVSSLPQAEQDAIMENIQTLVDLIDSEEVDYDALCAAANKLSSAGGYLGAKDWVIANHIMTIHKLVVYLEQYVSEEEPIEQEVPDEYVAQDVESGE